MRVLLDNECGAVAGGHQSDCEYKVTALLITGGAVAGGLATGGPGAIIGAGAGAVVAQVVARPYCAWVERQEAQEEDNAESGGGYYVEQALGSDAVVGDSGLPIHPPHQLVAYSPSDDQT